MRPDDEVVIEATVNTAMVVRLLRPFVGKVVFANPLQVRAITHAKIKTDKVDATVLAKLHASGFLPVVWIPDEATETAAVCVSTNSGGAADDPGEEPDPQHPPCQPDPTLLRPVVRRCWLGLVGGPSLGAG